ncbi:hypothetical protein ACFSR7_05910 [Cohnella sp. GCM10020058]|uniref:hypothetical protein n=1 Tax=Cohnella sp. GCM10020058 TaxID=3317330 RepID=UPI00362B4064
MTDQERLVWAEGELERLKVVIFEQIQQNAILRRENTQLKEQLAGRTITDKEERLLRIANSILDELSAETPK